MEVCRNQVTKTCQMAKDTVIIQANQVFFFSVLVSVGFLKGISSYIGGWFRSNPVLFFVFPFFLTKDLLSQNFLSQPPHSCQDAHQRE